MARLQQELRTYNGYKNYTITLNTDINLNNKDWTPIGLYATAQIFCGTFDGNGHTISNLKIDSTDNYKALFGAISDCTVKNLTVTGANVKGNDYLGILVGFNSGGTIENCNVQGSVEGTYASVGGIAGHNYNSATIKNCKANVTLSSSYTGACVGGIVGYNGDPSIVENCTARANITSGKYAGGIVGRNNVAATQATVKNCAFLGGTISGNPKNVIVSFYSSYTGIITDNYYYGELNGSGSNNATRIYKINNSLPSNVTCNSILTFEGEQYLPEGYNSLTYSGKTVEYLVSSDLTFTQVGNVIKVNGNSIFESSFLDSLNQENGFYLLESKTHLEQLANYVEQGNTCSGMKFKLRNNIEGVSFHIGTNTNKFEGTFDGGGKTISVSYSTNAETCALFNYVNNATIQNLTVDGSISTSAKYAAGIVSHSFGTTNIENCRASLTINYSKDNPADATCGGFVATQESDGTLTFTNCVFDGTLNSSGKAKCCGGFVGWNGGNSVTVNGCVFAPKAFDYYHSTNVNNNSDPSYVFVRGDYQNLKATITNSYYTQSLDVIGSGSTYVQRLNVSLPSGVTTTATVYNILGDNYITCGQVTFTVANLQYTTDINTEINSISTSNGVLSINGTAIEANSLILNQDSNGYYLITDKTQLQDLATYVNAGNDCSGKKFKLMADISGFNFHIGTSNNPFKGTFDGNEKTITVNYNSNVENCALFNYINGATIENLTVDGKITTSAKYAAGIVAQSNGTSSILNCRSSVEINSNVSGDGTHGGFVGAVNSNSNFTITNCIFDGKFIGTSTNSWGGLVGWMGGTTLTLSNSVFAPSEVSINQNSSHTFARNDNSSYNGNYYTKALNNTNVGTQVYNLTLPSDVTSDSVVTINGTNYIKAGTAQFSYNNKTYTAEIDADATITVDGGFKLNGKPVEANFPDNLSQDDKGYYLITSETQLASLAEYVNDGNDTSEMKFKLTKDLDLNTLGGDWTPIGNSFSTNFKGEFDGGNKIISNLKINSTSSYQGLFGYIDGNAAITNINLTDVEITGYAKVGGVVGKVESGTVSNCSVQGNITGNNSVGGVVGSSSIVDSVSNCAFLGGTVTATSTNLSVGLITGYIPNNNYTNYYYGDFSTFSAGYMYSATQVFKVTLPEGEDVTSESFVAKVGNAGYLKTGTVKFSYNNKTYIAEIDADATITVDGGFKLDGEAIEANFPDNLSQDDKGYYLITSETQLQQLANYVNTDGDTSGKKFKLTKDLDLSKLNGDWTPIGVNLSYSFKGEFDGSNKIISNLTIDNEDGNYQGLFGVIDGGATISNINLTGVNITGEDYVGGVVGYVDSGTVSNCSVQGDITATAENAYVGGVVGYNSGTVKNNIFFNGTFNSSSTYLNAIAYGGTLGTNYYYGTLASDVDPNDAAKIYDFNATLPNGVTSDAVVTLGDAKYIKSGNATFIYKGKYYTYNVTGEVNTVTLSNNKLTVNGDSLGNGQNLLISVNGEYSNTLNDATLSGGTGDDRITNSGSNVSINGGKGNDFITISDGENVTVNVKDGNDKIKVTGEIRSLTSGGLRRR